MPCTTLLVGKAATYDGSTFAARNEDSSGGHFDPKKMVVVHPEDQPRMYRSVLSHVEIWLSDHPLRYTAMPNAIPDEGDWAAAGVNSCNVSMTATETITSNERVLGADPLVRLVPAQDGKEEQPGGIGEEDMVTITLPYIRSAREGVKRLGSLLEKYGTYEINGIAFQDVNEIWWLETIGGHHWIARRVPDDCYVIMPNQLGIDWFDLDDALGEQKECMCSADMREFIAENYLDLSMDGEFNARDVFGSHSDADHIYNTPRAWYAQRYFNPSENTWDGMEAEYRPDSDDFSWCRVPEKKITVEDVKYVLSSHYQGTPYDPYGHTGDPSLRGSLRCIGVNRNNFLSLVQLRPYMPESMKAIEWVAFGSNVFNAFVPLYANVECVPVYFAGTTKTVTTENFYWANRIIGALSDAQYADNIAHIERYQMAVTSEGHRLISHFDKENKGGMGDGKPDTAANEEANEAIARMTREKTDAVLGNVLFTASNGMKNAFSRSDA